MEQNVFIIQNPSNALENLKLDLSSLDCTDQHSVVTSFQKLISNLRMSEEDKINLRDTCLNRTMSAEKKAFINSIFNKEF